MQDSSWSSSQTKNRQASTSSSLFHSPLFLENICASDKKRGERYRHSHTRTSQPTSFLNSQKGEHYKKRERNSWWSQLYNKRKEAGRKDDMTDDVMLLTLLHKYTQWATIGMSYVHTNHHIGYIKRKKSFLFTLNLPPYHHPFFTSMIW